MWLIHRPASTASVYGVQSAFNDWFSGMVQKFDLVSALLMGQGVILTVQHDVQLRRGRGYLIVQRLCKFLDNGAKCTLLADGDAVLKQCHSQAFIEAVYRKLNTFSVKKNG